MAPHSDTWNWSMNACSVNVCFVVCREHASIKRRGRSLEVFTSVCVSDEEVLVSQDRNLGFWLSQVSGCDHTCCGLVDSVVCLVCINVFCRSACGRLLLHVADMTNNAYKYECESFAYANINCWCVCQCLGNCSILIL